MAIVAMPILIVTSYVLYERCESSGRTYVARLILMFIVVLGEDRKLLVKPGLTKVEDLREDLKGESSSQS